MSSTSFSADAANAIGITIRTVERKTRIGEQLESVADQLTGTAIEDNQSELLALAQLQEKKPEIAAAIIEKLVAERDRPVIESEPERPTMAQAGLSALSDEEQEAVEFVRPDGEIVWKEDDVDDEPTVAVKPPSKATPVQKPKPQSKPKSKAVSVKAMVADLKKQDRIEAIERQAAAIEESLPGIPVGPFHVISLDPPWPYGTPYDPNGRRAANPYPEMSLEEIKALELPAADDCVLWLWTTHRFMRHSFELLDTWGFRDVAIMTWVKDRMGLGTWLRSQSEFCIMAVKGKPPIRLTNQTTILHGPLREHSRKPDSFYEMVDGLCVGAKLDYFSREKREGWAQVGNTPELFKEAA